MPADRVDCRGWKTICAFLSVSKPTAKKILKRNGLLGYDGSTPVLVIQDYLQKMRELRTKKETRRPHAT